MKSKISVILPAYNEEEAIGKVIDDVNSTMKQGGYDFEIIVVDDASVDRTAEIARSRGVMLLQHDINKGVGAARKTGILRCSGEIIVMLDSDGTYPAGSIPELLKYIPEYDQVIGARTSEQGALRMLRQPVKWVMFKLASFLAKQKIPDLNSGLRALKKDVLLKYLYLIPNGFSCVSTMTLSFLCNGRRIKYIPVDYYKRTGKSKFKIFGDTKDFLFTIIRIAMYFNPLRVLLLLSLLLFAIGGLKIAHSIIASPLHRMQESDAVILLSAVIILTCGLLADLIVNQAKDGNT
ncbi:MAG: glycosyltransferase family 2 protein [Candidatus Omnitrophica bacterium]|nr:glycosyltransferase family 2 protein [Candidatus Omnitrophota bacterium]